MEFVKKKKKKNKKKTHIKDVEKGASTNFIDFFSNNSVN